MPTAWYWAKKIKYHLDLDNVFIELSDYEFIKQKCNLLYKYILVIKHKLQEIKNNIKYYKRIDSGHIQRLHIYKELESSGIGIRELRIIGNAIKEIAMEYNIPTSKALLKFLNLLEIILDTKINEQIQDGKGDPFSEDCIRFQISLIVKP